MAVIKLYGNLRKISFEARHKLPLSAGFDIPAGTIQELLEALCASSAELCQALLNQGALRPHIRVIVNGLDIELAQGLDTPLKAEDQVSIFPPIAGG